MSTGRLGQTSLDIYCAPVLAESHYDNTARTIRPKTARALGPCGAFGTIYVHPASTAIGDRPTNTPTSLHRRCRNGQLLVLPHFYRISAHIAPHKKPARRQKGCKHNWPTGQEVKRHDYSSNPSCSQLYLRASLRQEKSAYFLRFLCLFLDAPSLSCIESISRCGNAAVVRSGQDCGMAR